MILTSNHLAIASMAFAVLAAATAFWGAITASRETNAQVKSVQAEAGVKISKAQADANVKIANAIQDAHVRISAARADADIKISASDSQSAAAARRAAEATERAALLEVQAATLQSQLHETQATVSGRTINPEQVDALVKALTGQVQHAIAVDGTWMDVETSSYAFQLMTAFQRAGIAIPPSYGMPAGSSGGGANQITMYVPGLSLSNPEAAKHDPVYSALTSLGVSIGLTKWVLEGDKQDQPDYYAIRVEPRGPSYLGGAKPYFAPPGPK